MDEVQELNSPKDPAKEEDEASPMIKLEGVEAPKVEAPKLEAPKVEVPKVETPENKAFRYKLGMKK